MKDLRFWGQCGIWGSSQKKKRRDNGQWDSVSISSLHFTPQVLLTSLNTLHHLSRSLRRTLLNSDFSWLRRQRRSVGGLPYFEEKSFHHESSIEWEAHESQWVCVAFWRSTLRVARVQLHDDGASVWNLTLWSFKIHTFTPSDPFSHLFWDEADQGASVWMQSFLNFSIGYYATWKPLVDGVGLNDKC